MTPNVSTGTHEVIYEFFSYQFVKSRPFTAFFKKMKIHHSYVFGLLIFILRLTKLCPLKESSDISSTGAFSCGPEYLMGIGVKCSAVNL